MNKKEKNKKITHHFAKYVKPTCVQNTTCNRNCPRICGLLNIVKGTFHGKLNILQLIFIDCCDEK